jgi:hypothetical protein
LRERLAKAGIDIEDLAELIFLEMPIDRLAELKWLTVEAEVYERVEAIAKRAV